MLRRMHDLHPEDMPALVAAAVAVVGGRDVQLYLADLGQEVLLRAGGDGELELDIDATVPGRCYRTLSAATTEQDEGRRAWVPMLDGADRLGVLGATFDDADGDAIEALLQIAGLTAELMVARAQYGDALALGRRRRRLTLASELRWAMLPPLTFATDRVTMSAVVEPAYDIAGDSFDYSMYGRMAHVGVFDAMGHGLEASRVVNLVIGAYRHGRRIGLDVGDTYRVMDAAVRDQFGESTFATGIMAELDTDTGELHVLLAGHHPPLLLRDGRLIGQLEVEPTLPIGIGDPSPAVGTFSLQPDDRVLLFSDGVIEARDADGELFGVERLADFLVRAAASKEPLPETMRRLSKAILLHQAGRLDDDATLLVVEWRRRS
jgi:serine phosphatase RsbU (regulator of sigma subunit)